MTKFPNKELHELEIEMRSIYVKYFLFRNVQDLLEKLIQLFTKRASHH